MFRYARNKSPDRLPAFQRIIFQPDKAENAAFDKISWRVRDRVAGKSIEADHRNPELLGNLGARFVCEGGRRAEENGPPAGDSGDFAFICLNFIEGVRQVGGSLNPVFAFAVHRAGPVVQAVVLRFQRDCFCLDSGRLHN